MLRSLICLTLGLALVASRAPGVPAPASLLAPATTVTLQHSGASIPFPDARSAVAAARTGDVVLLGPGTHRGPLVLTNASVTIRGEDGACVNANDPSWTPRWEKAPQFGRLAFASPIPFEPVTVTVDDRVMIDARASRGGLVLHDKGLDQDSRIPLQGVFTYLAKEHRLIVSFPDGSDPAGRRIEAAPVDTTAVAVRGADNCRIERLIVTGGETGIGLEHTQGSVVDHCLVYSVDTCIQFGKGASSCRALSCDLTMNPDALNLDCDQLNVGKAVWHAHKHVGTYDKHAVLAEQAGDNNEVAGSYLYNMWDGVENDSGVSREDVAAHYSNQVFKGIAEFNRGLKIHHNRLDLAMDDALEPGDELVDNQWFANVITRARCAARFKTVALGPFYFYDNVVLDSGNCLRLYKSMPACATVYIFNNVIRHKTGIIYLKVDDVCWSDPWLARTMPRGTPGFRIFNNVFVCTTAFANTDGGTVAPNFVADYNLYTAATTPAYPTNGLDPHSLFGASPVFADVTNGNWRLATNSPGKGAGCALSAFCPKLPPELAARAGERAPDLGVPGIDAPRGPVSGLWQLAQTSINLGERDVAAFSLDPSHFVPLRPLWDKAVPGTLPLDPYPVAPSKPQPAKQTERAVVVVGDQPADVLRNGTFAKLAEGGTPAEWRLYGSATFNLEGTEDDVRLNLTTKTVSPETGSLSQTITGLPPDTQLVLTGKVRGSKDKLASLQIKLKDGKREIKRFNSGPADTEEKELRITCSTLNATSIAVECRYSQGAAGEHIWLSDFKLQASHR